MTEIESLTNKHPKRKIRNVWSSKCGVSILFVWNRTMPEDSSGQGNTGERVPGEVENHRNPTSNPTQY